MKVFVTGGAGYIGSIITRKLLDAGHDVTVYDALMFGKSSIEELEVSPHFRLVVGDIREREKMEQALVGQEAVIHLAAIVGDPACAADADLAVAVNFNATVTCAELAKRAGISRFVFASTCSVYGANADTVDEESELNPLSLYAQTRLYGERSIRSLAEGKFQPVILRLGTVYGLSPRMRFDLVVNYLTLKLFREGEISIFGGEQWRPLVHVSDVAEAFVMAFSAPDAAVAGKTFNVGSNEGNYQLKELITFFQEVKPDAKVQLVKEMDDKRSYRVRFDRIKQALGYEPKYTPKRGIQEILDALQNGTLTDLDAVRYYNHKTIAQLHV